MDIAEAIEVLGLHAKRAAHCSISFYSMPKRASVVQERIGCPSTPAFELTVRCFMHIESG